MKRRPPCIPLLLVSILFIISCASGQKTVQNPEPPRVSAPAKASEPAKAPEPAAPSPKSAPPVKDTAPVPQKPRPALILEGAQCHRVVWGDTLSSLSKKYYGPANGYYFPLIALASTGVIANPDVIIPGMILTIPDLKKNLADPQARSALKSYLQETAQLYERKRDPKTRNHLIQLANSL
jgi:nucleoid-associated protein YgaU